MTITAHNTLCSTRAYHLRIDLALDATVGNVAWKTKKNSTHHQDQSMEILATRERGECIFIPLKIAIRKRYKNAVDGVELAAIQIAEDPI